MFNINTLFTSLKELPGVAEKKLGLLYSLGCSSFLDLLLHLPSRFVLKQFEPDSLVGMEEGRHVIVSVSVHNIDKRITKGRGKQITEVLCSTKLGEELELVFFNYFPDYIFRGLRKEAKIIVAGKLTISSSGFFQLAHPKIYRTLSEIKKIDAIYPLVAGLSPAYISKLSQLCIESLERQQIEIREWLAPELLAENGWLGFFESIKTLHLMQDEKGLEIQDKLRERIAFDELLANQLAIRLFRKRHLDDTGEALEFSGELASSILASTGFALTPGQASALHDIQCDQKYSKRMIRLLQGDVGSGKTLVALISALNALESGKQAALMVPTDILSNQHFNLISKLLKPFDIKVELLTGATAKSKRKIIDAELKSGEIKILIGTHALFQKDIEFKSLGLVIIDEQHRFGVQQRLALMDKNKTCDVLAMSATPIPRTLALIMYGDMDVSIIKDKPAGRIPIRTITTLDSKVNLIVEIIRKKIEEKEKVFWICPLIEQKIEEDPEADLKEPNHSTAVARFDALKKIFGDKVGLVHGKLKDSEKEASMQEFAHGKVDILVATTVIEVGIDVPEATLLIIEQAEKFGLSQLHQLRGRIGRGSKASDCILMFSHIVGAVARERLRIMKTSNDGFYIAEQDLKLRGGGEILGHKQSGLPEFKTVCVEKHYPLMHKVSEYAKQIIDQQDLESFYPLMQIFGYDVASSLIDA